MNILILLFIAIFCPPLAVFMNWGCSGHLVLNIFLTSFVWLLGIGHAWIMIFASVVISCADSIMEFIKENGARRTYGSSIHPVTK
ncbi:hypothetical protein Y032_0123g1168 [Ancylostoma ceylanicum]|uniref:YqaE/Pmp3 family membrane protein n=1 Tax=Ancylostoma ceylanicum TaxID=53326 RepID=A0A016T9M6_9BILA|nr:hypothetical protein Y032_0123g1168 [Ancylostoma ceylanicum]